MLQEQQPEALDPVTDLLESRRVSEAFPSNYGKIRVETRIRVSRFPWTLRATVLRDGVEVQTEPIVPIEEQVKSVGTGSDLVHAREAFARLALRRHESLCRLVQEDLATPGGGILEGRAVSSHLLRSVKRILLCVVVGVMLMIVVTVATVLLMPATERSRSVWKALPAGLKEIEDPEPAGEKSEEPQSDFQESPQEDLAANETEADLVQQARPVPASQAEPRFSEEKEDSLEQVVEAGEPGMSVNGEEASRQQREELISDIDPVRYEGGNLGYGQRAYVDADVSFTGVPSTFAGMACIRTANSDRALDASLSFSLGQNSLVYVLHDRRIGRKPSWLRSFAYAGWGVQISGPVEEEQAILEAFVQERQAGRVILGPNTEWTSATRAFRNRVPKDLSMYVVCVEPR